MYIALISCNYPVVNKFFLSSVQISVHTTVKKKKKKKKKNLLDCLFFPFSLFRNF